MSKTPKALVAAAATATVLVLAACGSAADAISDDGEGSSVVSSEDGASTADGAEESQTAEQVIIVDYGFSEVPPAEYSTTVYTPYAAVFQNPDTKNFADAQVRFVFKDAAGTVIATEEEYLTSVFPGSRAALSGQLFDTPGAASMEVQVLPGATEEAPEGTAGFTVDQVNTTVDEYQSVTTTAQVTNPFAKDLSDVMATAVYRNGEGKIIGGAYSYVSFIPAQGATGVEITGASLAGSPAKTDVFLSLTSLTLLADG